MNKKPTDTSRSNAILRLIENHLATRFKKEKERGKAKKKEDYRFENILKKGVEAGSNVTVATHTTKAIHSGLQVKEVTNLRVQFDSLTSLPATLGSHVLPTDESLADTTGNGRYDSSGYELYLVLDLKFEGKSLLQWLDLKDPDVIYVLSSFDADKRSSTDLTKGCFQLMENKCPIPASSDKAKQIYWRISDDSEDDAAYHLLAPLYPASLVHAVYNAIHEDLVSPSNKIARKALIERKPYDGPNQFPRYLNLAIHRIGGDNPQNISKLNSARNNNNYLLSSLPPSLRRTPLPRSPNSSEEVWKQFYHFKSTDKILANLASFLKKKRKDNMINRQKEEDFAQALGAQLAVFARFVEAQTLPGWTRADSCNLDLNEKLWLDSRRAKLSQESDSNAHSQEDAAFKEAYDQGDWADQIAGLFANFVNTQLGKLGLEVGSKEYQKWARQAVINVAWPQPMRRRAPIGGQQ